jgi:hypothetical protein
MKKALDRVGDATLALCAASFGAMYAHDGHAWKALVCGFFAGALRLARAHGPAAGRRREASRVMKRRLTFVLGLVQLAIDGIAFARHIVLGTEPAWVERMRGELEDMEREP